MRSLRTRLLVGALLWMSGAMVVIGVLTNVLFSHEELSRRERWLVHYSAMAVAVVTFTAVGLMMVHRSLGPLRDLRKRLGEVRDAKARTIEGEYPSEVQPLVDDLNALLDDRDRAIARAHATAGDLAHGLKTPLAILAQEAERLGSTTPAKVIGQQVDRMRRQIEWQLAHARATASAGNAPGVRCNVRESAEALARTMLRLHADRGVTIDVQIASDHEVRVRREDLDEMLGNLLDNACKWAKTRVVVACRPERSEGPSAAHDGRSFAVFAAQDDKGIAITVDDDGAGLDPSKREAVLQRGVRADEAAPGSGLGLAIVRDLAELYGGTIALEESPLGGVRARLQLPAA